MKTVRIFLYGFLIASMLLAACGPAATTAPSQAPQPTQA
jgi:predicted small secreted protein